MNVETCTLFEGDFHYGVAALANSLFHSGYRGRFWAGYRGALPPWCDARSTFSPADGFEIVFVPLETTTHFTHYKPQWMQSIFERHSPSCIGLAYFDPDIVVRCRWSFFEDWISRGLALCEDVNHYMPADHPIKLSWADFLTQHGYAVRRTTHQYFNGGFLGLQRAQIDALEIWARLVQLVEPESGRLDRWRSLDRSHRFMSANQDTLNAMIMTVPHPLATLGPEGMDFAPGGFTMSHALGSPKPWAKAFVREALCGAGPRAAEKAFWQFADGPIRPFESARLRRAHRSLRVAGAIGRFIRRA